MDSTGLKAGGMDGIQNLMKLTELSTHLSSPWGYSMKLGVDTRQGYIGQ